jgi:hypothetical protein
MTRSILPARPTRRPGRTLGLAIAAAAAALGLAACSSTIAGSDVEAEIESQLEDSGRTGGSADCPEELNAEVGSRIECAVTTDDGDSTVVAEVTSVEGDEVGYDLTEE